MRLFLDTSVLLAASGSAKGASRFVIDSSEANGWRLLTSPYCVEETLHNLRKLGPGASRVWKGRVYPALEIVPNQLVLDRMLIFPNAKDRPVLIGALAAGSDYLLTLDQGDFQNVLGLQVYGMLIRTPGTFLLDQRESGHL